VKLGRRGFFRMLGGAAAVAAMPEAALALAAPVASTATAMPTAAPVALTTIAMPEAALTLFYSKRFINEIHRITTQLLQDQETSSQLLKRVYMVNERAAVEFMGLPPGVSR
jgi:hypothetical protein